MTSICSRCQQPRLQWGPLLAPHRCLASAPITKAAPIFNEPSVATTWWGQDAIWAPAVYAEYYATSPLVYAAVKLRADALARPRLKVWTMSADGTEQESLEDHPLQLLLDKASEFWASGDLWRGTSTLFDLYGAAFWVLDKGGPGSLPTRIWLARPDRMRVIPSKDSYISGYEYGAIAPGSGKRYRPDEVVWFRNFNPLDEFAGISPIAPARLSIDMATDAAAHNRNVFKTGLLSDSVITSKGPVTQAQVDDLWERLRKKFSGPQNSHRPMVLDSEMDAKMLTLSARDMEFMASLRWSLEDVCRCFGVPKTLLHDLEKATYSNVDAEERIFWRNTIVPLLKFYESAINEMLVPQFADDGSIFVQFDLTEIEALQENEVEIADQEREDVKAGILTINEVRERRGLEPVPWGDEPPQPALSPFGGGQEQSPGDGKPPRPMPQRALGNGKATFALRPHQPFSSWPADYRRWQPPETSEGFLDNAWREYSKRFDGQTDRFLAVQRDLFRRQLAAVLRALRLSGAVAGLALFDPADWLQEFLDQGRQPLAAALVSNANAQIDLYGLGISFDLSRPLLQDWLNARLNFWALHTNEETARLLTQELAAAVDAGEGIGDISRRVEKVFSFNDTVRAERIARTEVLAGSNHGALEAYKQSGVVERKAWLATRDQRTRDAHAEANGQTVPLDAPFLIGGESIMAPGEGSPAMAVNCRCHPAGTVVDARSLLKVYRRWYEGELVEVTTALGNKLSGTPNHPVLTDAGWVALGNLAEGDHVISSIFGERMGAVDPDVNHMPAKIGDIYDALAVAGDGQRVDGSPMDFHGDGGQGQIDVVAPNDALPQWGQAAGCQHGQHLRLSPAHGQMSLPGRNASLERVEEPQLIGVTASPPLNVGSPQPGAYHVPAGVEGFGKTQLGLPSKVTLNDGVIVQAKLGSASGRAVLTRQPLPGGGITEQPSFLQTGGHPTRVGAVSPANSFDTLTGQVIPDRVLNISIRRFVGHVYNLQTAEGFYAANGIIAHNCTLTPVLERSRSLAPVHSNGKEA